MREKMETWWWKVKDERYDDENGWKRRQMIVIGKRLEREMIVIGERSNKEMTVMGE